MYICFSDGEYDQELASASSETFDSCGIPGWGKVSKVAEALIGLSGLGVTSQRYCKAVQ